jgi:ribosomal protein L11 methylase PrmA
MASQQGEVPASFRDPSGFVFLEDGRVYRQVNRYYQEDFDHLVNSGLHHELVRDGMLIPHAEVGLQHAVTEDAYKVIRPQPIPFVSYPYEWCFSQLQAAALLTLSIQAKALECGMSLKDASAYNIQFAGGKPVLVDTLSFEIYCEGQPWVAYRQFCQHFLAPLALMQYVDVRLSQLFRVFLDGIPLNLARRMLPRRTQANFGLLTHIHLHAKAQERFANTPVASTGRKVGRTAFLGLLDSLRSTTEKLKWQPGGTDWHDYYDISSYSDAAMKHKKQLVAEMLDRITPVPSSVWDLGANTGVFGRLASDRGIPTICLDLDPAATESNYLASLETAEQNILPLIMDLTNPSPGIGWAHRERMSLVERGPADVVIALALVHHLAIANNLPFNRIARFLGLLCHTLIIEYVPKSDSQVQRLLSSRKDIFDKYDQGSFDREFGAFFEIVYSAPIMDTERTLYLMTRGRKDCAQDP